MLFVLFTYSLISIQNFPEATRHIVSLNADADMRNQLSSIKPDIKRVVKMQNNDTLLTKVFV